MTDDTMELTHQDLTQAIDRIIQQLEVIDASAIFNTLNVGMFDVPEVTRVLNMYKTRILVDAHAKGALEWK